MDRQTDKAMERQAVGKNNYVLKWQLGNFDQKGVFFDKIKYVHFATVKRMINYLKEKEEGEEERQTECPRVVGGESEGQIKIDKNREH
jgi:hypothetical protein